MKSIAMAGFLILGLLLLIFHNRLTEFQMAIYRRSLPTGWVSSSLRAFDDRLTILVGVGFVVAALGYFLGYLR
jgi:hypothetical protein